MEKEERDKSSAEVADETGDSVTVSERRSQREKKNKRAFSPVLEEDTKKKRKKLPRPFSYTSSSRPCDLLPNGEPFCCKLCKSPYVTNPYAKGVRKAKRSRHVPLPKKRLDSVGREILVCNACCQILDRQIRPKKPNKELTAEERNKYLEDAKTFAKSLAETLNEPKAEKLYCPVSVYKICGCLQKYIKGKDTDETALELRVTELLDLMKEATHLREQKVYTVPENLGTSKYSRRRLKYIGYGNGHKKSKEYEEFVLDKRRVLKEDMRLCERATQRILLYSNNFLHKKLKTEERPCRITRTKGKAALGKLHDIDSLHKQTCCIDGCVRLSLTHPNLLKSWRSRAVSGQMEARKVIAEMLTPAGGYRLNCYQFVSMVTGCALTTIGKVNNQLRETGGRQDPPEHGMKRLWTNGQRNRTDTVSSTYGSDSHTGEPPVVQTQSVTGPELTSHVLRPSQSQANSTSTDIQAFPALPQGEVIRIEELMKKKYELQQQQQIVQYQIQQTLGQHSGLPQNTGWITPQLIGQFPNTIGSSNSSFVPVGNISQTEFPQYIPSISNFSLGQTNPSQFQLSTSQNMLVSKLNVPVLEQLGSSDSQIPTVTNHFFYDSNQVTSVNSHANLGPGPFQPTKSLSVGSSNTLQPVIEVVNLGQAQTDGEESNPGASKTQPLIGRQIIADYDNSVSSDAQLPHVLNSSVPNLTQFSHLNQNHFIPNLSPTITNQFEHTTASSKPVLKHVLLGAESSPTFPTELIHQPLLLSPVDPILQQIQTDKQGLLSDVSFTSEDNNSVGTVNINDLGKDASNVMLAFVDQNGVTHQFTFPNSAVEMESQLFSVNNKPAAIAGDLNPSYQGSNHAEQQINVQEQFNDQSSEDLAAYLSGGVQVSRLNVGNLSVLKPGDHLGETSGTHEFDKQSVAQTSRQIRDENNKETSTVSTKETLDKFPVSLRLLSAVKENQTVQNSNLSSNVSKNLETVGLTLPTAKKPDHDMTEPALSIRVFPNVVDKSTNTCVEQINDQNSCELNTKETDSNRESINKVTSSCESDTNIQLIGREKSRNFAKQDKGSTEKIRALQKGFEKAFGRNSPGDYSSEGSIDNMSSKLECNQTVDKYQEGKKQDRNHRSKHSPKEGFQKLQSRNGKVFLHSNSQRTAFEKHVKETQDASTYSDVEKLQLPNNESHKEKTVAKCTSIMQAEEKGGSDSNSSQTKTLQVSEKVKNKLRKSLNIPILPKPTKPAQPDLKLPVELQPLDSSLFVIPQSSQNITSLKHMTKSKVQVQQPVRIVQVGTTNAAATPPVSSAAISAIDQPVSQSINQIHKPAFSNSLVDGQQIYFTDVASNISEITLLASNQNVRDGHDRNLSGNDAVSISQANVLSDNEMNSLQTSTSIREEQEAFRASETGITPDIRNINIDGCTSTSTSIMTIGNLPPFFLQNIHIVSPPVQNNAFASSLDSPIKDHSLTVVKKTDGQSVLALPFSHSLKAPQGPTASPKSRKQRFPNKTKKSASAARAHVPPVPVILSANEKRHPKMSETRDHSPVQLVELSSDVIQKGVQEELNLLQTHSDSHV